MVQHHTAKSKKSRREKKKKENIASHADLDIKVDQSLFIRGFVQVIIASQKTNAQNHLGLESSLGGVYPLTLAARRV